MMHIVCADMEGIFTPEIWIAVAEITGIEDLRLTTRDISDYDVLMKRRLAILKKHGLKLQDIRAVIAKMKLLDGALEFLNWLRSRLQVIIVSPMRSLRAHCLRNWAGPRFSATRCRLRPTGQF
jgi:phosphoserine/homoserine phosphotransferase